MTISKDTLKEFSNVIKSIAVSEGQSTDKIFTTWLKVSAVALMSAVTPQSAEKDRLEELYQSEIKSIRKNENLEQLSNALSLAMEYVNRTKRDFLSPMFMEHCASKQLGQFFTPYELCKLTAAMTIGDAADLKAKLASGEVSYLSLHEPAAGVGGMVLATSETLQESGIDVSTQVLWHCIDKDWLAVCGCFLQTALAGIPAVIVHGDTLRAETYNTYINAPALNGPLRVQFAKAA